jgi:hypothetical protein
VDFDLTDKLLEIYSALVKNTKKVGMQLGCELTVYGIEEKL